MKLMELKIQLLAHKKGQGSTKNGRDSESKRLGAKAADGEFVTGGSILYRQRGTKVYPGTRTCSAGARARWTACTRASSIWTRSCWASSRPR